MPSAYNLGGYEPARVDRMRTRNRLASLRAEQAESEMQRQNALRDAFGNLYTEQPVNRLKVTDRDALRPGLGGQQSGGRGMPSPDQMQRGTEEVQVGTRRQFNPEALQEIMGIDPKVGMQILEQRAALNEADRAQEDRETVMVAHMLDGLDKLPPEQREERYQRLRQSAQERLGIDTLPPQYDPAVANLIRARAYATGNYEPPEAQGAYQMVDPQRYGLPAGTVAQRGPDGQLRVVSKAEDTEPSENVRIVEGGTEEAIRLGLPAGMRGLFQVTTAGDRATDIEPFDAGGEDAPDVGSPKDLRGEFTKLTEDFRDVQSKFQTVKTAATNPSAANDLSLIFAYMKMLDPHSVVREGEQAIARNAAGVPQRVRNIYNRVLSGETLAPEQRQDFLQAAENQYAAARQGYKQIEEMYTELARSQDYDPSNIVLPFGRQGEGGQGSRTAFGNQQTAPRQGGGDTSTASMTGTANASEGDAGNAPPRAIRQMDVETLNRLDTSNMTTEQYEAMIDRYEELGY